MLNVFSHYTIPEGNANLLGGLTFGNVPQAIGEPTVAHVAMMRLDDAALLYQTVSGTGIVREGRIKDVHYRLNDHLLYGIVTVRETGGEPATTGTPLQTATYDAYQQIFTLLRAQGFPYALRFWNYMTDINGHSHDLERYRQFNLGRQQAFTEHAQAIAGNVPAACALGMAEGPLTIAFLAGRQPAQAIENPRQINAWDYPEQYGPRSPLFARASIVSVDTSRTLFISGTASIVGHATLHAGDIAAQTEESIANISAVLDETERTTGLRCTLDSLDCIVYVRHARDFEQVRSIVEKRIGTSAAYLKADICRSDLLVEIEASALAV